MNRDVTRAADIAAREVESVISAAQVAAERIKQEGQREAERIRADGQRAAASAIEDARLKAVELGEDARREAAIRIAEAQRAADEALEETRALSRGLRQLAATLTDQAERLLREVESGHRRISAELRAPSGAAAARSAPSAGSGEPPRRRDNPFDDLEVPGWLDR